MGRGVRAWRASWGREAPKREKPAASYSRAGGSRTTLGEEALDFRVRDGNGYGRLSMATGGKPEIGTEGDCSARRRGDPLQ